MLFQVFFTIEEYFMAIDNMDYTYIFQRKILLKWKYKMFLKMNIS